ncbi:YmfQ family protein [Pseudomonas knackmussii]|uniref:YmfQ family protein n=1 Tax=Pseudomonas knackmussii TaxID=65741 RepID=UPI00136406A7|nr:putative phage tail protein [Pseudomonas knackmussii]
MTSLADQLRLLLPPVSYNGLAEGLSAVIEAEAAALDATTAQAASVYDAMFPDTGSGLSDWERVLGLPDLCVADDVLTISQRVQAVVSKLQARYGQSRAFFIELARALGYEITISTFRPARAGRAWAGDPINGGDWNFTWRVNGPAVTINHAQAGVAAAGEPLAAWGNKQLECRLGQLKPAESILLFGYAPFDQTLSLLDALPSIMSLKRAGAGTYMDAAGLLQIAAADEPRFDYDPVTLQPRGLLIEEQRTNLFLNSENFAASSWAKSSYTVTPGAPSVKGDNSAFTLRGTSDGISPQLFQSCALTGSLAAVSFVVSSAGASYAYVQLQGAVSINTAIRAIVSLSDGTYNTQVFGTGFSTPLVFVSSLGSGRFRITLAGAVNLTGENIRGLLGASMSATSVSTVTMAQGLNAECAQFEGGAYPASYIPTTSSQVTRAADVAIIDVPVGFTRLTYQYDDGSSLAEQVRSGRPHIVPIPPAPKRIKSILMAA